MSNDPGARAAIERIEAPVATLGEGMQIRRAIPTRHRRLIGAWCFLDHFGPVDVSGGKGMRVGPHPHSCLQTVTWLIEGEILHRDSLGSLQVIRSGQLNLMTAGRGISHSEESPMPHPPGMHGVQFWIALPDSARFRDPAFHHHPTLPLIERDGAHMTLLVGQAFGEISPARVYSPLVGLDVVLRPGSAPVLPLQADFEHGLLVTQGAIEVDGDALTPGTLLYLPPGRERVSLRSSGPARVTLIGGEPLEEPVLMWWNFVGRDKDELTQYCREWNAQSGMFGEVSGYDGARLTAPLPPWATA